MKLVVIISENYHIISNSNCCSRNGNGSSSGSISIDTSAKKCYTRLLLVAMLLTTIRIHYDTNVGVTFKT